MARRLRVAFVTTQSDTDPDQEFIPASVFYPHEGVYATGGGATSPTPHRELIDAWANGTTGDYAGANGLTQSSATAYDSEGPALVSGTATSLDVLQAVNEWLDGTYDNYGFMVRRTSASGTAVFHSKEAINASFRPRLALNTTTGSVTLSATSDTHTTGSLNVVQSPNNATLSAGSSGFILLYFDLSAVTGTVTAASLQLTPSSSATVTVGVYRTDMDQLMPDIEFESGLAYSYPNDAGVENDPNVIFAEDFSSDEWSTGMSADKDQLMEDKGWRLPYHFTPWEERPAGQIQEGEEHNATIIGDTDPDDPNFVPLVAGRQCVKTRMGVQSEDANDNPPFKRLNNWLSWSWNCYGNLGPIWEEYNAARGALLDENGAHHPEEPEELYTRMYFRFGHWNARAIGWNTATQSYTGPEASGGKWPNGMRGTYDTSLTGNSVITPVPPGGPYALRKYNAPPRAGNGGLRSYTCAGWSLRGSFYPAPLSTPAFYPQADDTPLQQAGYHRIIGECEDWSSVEEGAFDSNSMTLNYLGLIKENTWHCHELRIKMNSIDTTGATIAYVGYPFGGLYSNIDGGGAGTNPVNPPAGLPRVGAIAHSGTCSSTGTTSTIVLNIDTSSDFTNFYNNYAVRISTRPTEVRLIVAYNKDTKVATITSHKDSDGTPSATTWTNIPQSGETFQLIQNTSIQERTTLYYGTNRGFIYADEDAVLWGTGSGIPAIQQDTEILESPGIGRRDGIRQIWIDGRLAASETNIWFRSIPNIQIEGFWYPGFMGGSGPIPQDESWMYLSEIVVAKSYIGPMRTT
jgi:hypothetical protein